MSDAIETVVKIVLGALLVGVSIFVLAVIGGTIVWAFWDNCIQYVFPRLVADGYVAADISWWQAVTLTWVFGILIKASSSNNNSKEKN